jgi:hypothetical protein
MGKETTVTRTPPLSKVPPRTESPVRTMPMEKSPEADQQDLR